MKCLYCDAPVLINGYCSQCKLKQDYIKKAYNTSSYYYNQGLDKAKIRDLSGAVTALEMSLKYNKKNIDARNLLGLVHYEMGEMVDALSQWVISKHFKEKGNVAETYIKEIQSNPSKLDSINQSIKKYNQTLLYAKQGSKDLALIQLKKVLSLSPHFVNGYLLLALLHIDAGNYEKARKALLRVTKIDKYNTMALNYLKEVEEATQEDDRAVFIKDIQEERPEPIEKEQIKEKKNNLEPVPVGKYKEINSGKFSIVYVVVGVVLGIAVTWFLIAPGKVSSMQEEYRQLSISYSDEIAKKNVTITSLEDENLALTETNASLQEKVNGITANEESLKNYDALFAAAAFYLDNNILETGKELGTVNKELVTLTKATELYDKIYSECGEEASSQLYDSGYELYSAEDYAGAIPLLYSSYYCDTTNLDALYFLARAYDQSEDQENANKYYNLILSDFPDTERASQAEQFVN